MVIGRAKSSWGRRNGVVWDSGLRKGSAGFVWLGRAHGARDGSADGGHALGLGDFVGNAVECGRAMPENGIDVADPGRGNRPSLGTGLRSTVLSFICDGAVLFHSTKCAARLGDAARRCGAVRHGAARRLRGAPRRRCATRRGGSAARLGGGGGSAQQRGEVAARFGGSAARRRS